MYRSRIERVFGMMTMHLNPLAAATMAYPIPVLLLVKSTMVFRPGAISPRASARSIMFRAMRSFIEPPGLVISSLASTVAWRAAEGSERSDSRTRGVRPIVSK